MKRAQYPFVIAVLAFSGLAPTAEARIDYINDRINPALGIVEARGTCNHSRTTPFPGEQWRVMKIGGETSYQGPADRGRVFIDKPIEEWEMALCQVSQRSVKDLLKELHR